MSNYSLPLLAAYITEKAPFLLPLAIMGEIKNALREQEGRPMTVQGIDYRPEYNITAGMNNMGISSPVDNYSTPDYIP